MFVRWLDKMDDSAQIGGLRVAHYCSTQRGKPGKRG